MIEKIKTNADITLEELKYLLETQDEEVSKKLFEAAREITDRVYGKKIYIRGLIEFTNFCKNDCYYCGIRKSNCNAERYRLTKEQISDCTDAGYELGFRTFVLQGGEDMYFTDGKICEIISSIKNRHPDCAVTLSIGEKSKESYRAYFEAGADRYLLRHETADDSHYRMLHPEYMLSENRKRCLYDLKDIGYQVGCGFMVGSPFQSMENIYEDLMFIKELQPHMVGIGPFIPMKDTPFAIQKAGTLDMTLKLLAIIRIMNRNVLLPATTALATIHSKGRELGIAAGANVIMPNLSPKEARRKYILYDNKKSFGDEAAEEIRNITERMKYTGYSITVDRGDYKCTI